MTISLIYRAWARSGLTLTRPHFRCLQMSSVSFGMDVMDSQNSKQAMQARNVRLLTRLSSNEMGISVGMKNVKR